MPAFEGGKVAGEYFRDGFLRAGFADAAGNNDYNGVPAPQYGAGVLLESDARIFYYDGGDGRLLELGALRVRKVAESACLY